jgi:hypothetical protein
MCQRAAGAPVVAWAAFRRSDFRFVRGHPDPFRASDRAVRRHCAACGTALTFEYDGAPDTIDVTIASLDDPTATEPIYQIWTSSRLPWFHLDEHGPQFPGDSPSTTR